MEEILKSAVAQLEALDRAQKEACATGTTHSEDPKLEFKKLSAKWDARTDEDVKVQASEIFYHKKDFATALKELETKADEPTQNPQT